MRFLALAVLLLALGAAALMVTQHLSHIGSPSDPNDPGEAGVLTPEVLRYNLRGASDSLLERQRNGEITKEQFDDLMAKAANGLLDRVKITRIPPNKAWEYGEIFITAKRWQDARSAFEIAVKVAKGENRRVNDTLRLARSMAELGDAKNAVATARQVFNAPDEAAAPILPATLLEIVPAAEGKGADEELAGLLEDAIKCEMRTIVDPKSEAGQMFFMARPHHVRNAWAKAIQLYQNAGKFDKAAQAGQRAEATLRELASA